jgi:hypothetical protein
MKKSIWISLIVVMTFMMGSIAMAKPEQAPPGQQGIVINGTIINACYQKINGQLRVVSDPGQCRPSEVPITLSSPAQPKTVFITSVTFPGAQIGGIAGADAICNALAAAAVPILPGTYKAWISDDFIGPATTFIHNMGPYVNTVGNVIANDWIGLTSGVLLNPIRYSESGVDLTPASGGPIDVWTGTDTFGNPLVGLTCVGWTAVGLDGMPGNGNSTNTTWTLAPTLLNCAQDAHLYCFEQ